MEQDNSLFNPVTREELQNYLGELEVVFSQTSRHRGRIMYDIREHKHRLTASSVEALQEKQRKIRKKVNAIREAIDRVDSLLVVFDSGDEVTKGQLIKAAECNY